MDDLQFYILFKNSVTSVVEKISISGIQIWAISLAGQHLTHYAIRVPFAMTDRRTLLKQKRAQVP